MKWQQYPKAGESWITSECGTTRILKCFNDAKPATERYPSIEPVTYLRYAGQWQMDKGKRVWRGKLVGSYTTLDEAKA